MLGNIDPGSQTETIAHIIQISDTCLSALRHRYPSWRLLKSPRAPIMSAQIRQVRVAGAGTMGNGIAQTFAAAGYPVIMHDLKPEYLDRGMAKIGNSLERLASRGTESSVVGRIRPSVASRSSGLILSRSATWSSASCKLRELHQRHWIEEVHTDDAARILRGRGVGDFAGIVSHHLSLSQSTRVSSPHEFAQLFGTGPVPHLKRSPLAETEWTDEARTAFDVAFAEDIEVWKSSTVPFHALTSQKGTVTSLTKNASSSRLRSPSRSAPGRAELVIGTLARLSRRTWGPTSSDCRKYAHDKL